MAGAEQGRGLAAASVAIDPAPFRGVLPLPISAVKSAGPVLGNPANRNRAIPLTYDQFRYAFANADRGPDFLRMTIELGAACCLRKPFTPDALLTSVNQCITTPKASVRHSNS